MLSKPLSPAYTRRCLSALSAFAQPGDGIVALCPCYEPTASCGLCQRSAIYRCFPIENTRTGATLMLGVECIQAYRTLVKGLRRKHMHYRDPGTIGAILQRYRRRGALTEEQVRDFLLAGQVHSGGTSHQGQQRERSAWHIETLRQDSLEETTSL